MAEKPSLDMETHKKTDMIKDWMNRELPSPPSACSTTTSSDNNNQSSLSSLESFLFLPQLPVDGDDDEEAWLFRHHYQQRHQPPLAPPPSSVTVISSKPSSIYNSHGNQPGDKKKGRQWCSVTTRLCSSIQPPRDADIGTNNHVCGKSGYPNNSLFPFIAANDTVIAAASNSTNDLPVNKTSQKFPSMSIFIKNNSNSTNSSHSHKDSHSPFYLAANHHQHSQHHHFSRRRLLIFRICQAFSVLICILFLINLVKHSIWVNNEYNNRIDSIPETLSVSALATSRLQNRLIQSWNMPSIISPSSSIFKIPQMLSNSSGGDNDNHKLLLLDVPNFKFLMNNKTKCNVPRDNENYIEDGRGTNSLFFMIIVHSDPQNFEERQAIRKTWGSLQRLGQFHIRLVFLLGHEFISDSVTDKEESNDDNANTSSNQTDDHQNMLKIQRESEQNGDIVTGNFHDSYRNLTYKHLMGYLWVLNHCSHAKYVLKADDDAFIDIFQLFEFLMKTFGPEPEAALICNVFPEGTKPVRQTDTRGKKWAVTYEEYPYETYPKYCGGLAYLATPNVIHEIYRMSLTLNNSYFWIDDVYVLGVLRQLAHVEPFYLNLRYSYEPEEYRKWLAAGARTRNEINDNGVIHENRKDVGVGVAILSNQMKNYQRASPPQKMPFMIVHLERGSQLGSEMKELWNKTMTVWSESGIIL